MGKICLIYNFAQQYRTAIFKAIDQHWDSEWYFGRNTTDIKGMDISVLRNANIVENKKLKGPYFYQSNVSHLTRRKDISTFFLLGDPHCLSNWWIAAKTKLFHKDKKVYFWTHGWYGKESKVTRIIKKVFFNLADGIFLYGNHARNLMIKEGFDLEKLYTIHNSLDYASQVNLRNSLTESNIYKEHFKNDFPTIIFIGRLTPVKKLDMLVDAVKLLKDEGVNVNLVFVGDGTERGNIEARVKEKEIKNNTWFYGACYDDKINAELIYNADLCVAPGNVGLTAMHTMVFGTPVISHNDFKWQMPEFEAIKPGLTGEFFERDNVVALSDSIKKWLCDNKDRNLVRQNCYDEIDQYWTPTFQMDVLKRHLEV